MLYTLSTVNSIVTFLYLRSEAYKSAISFIIIIYIFVYTYFVLFEYEGVITACYIAS